MMRDEERLARDLAAQLRAFGVDALVTGEGVHWRVTAGDTDTRSIVAHCFWYEGAAGQEVAVDFVDDLVTAANGRSRSIEPVLVAVRHWLGGSKLEDIVAIAPFVDARKRAARAIAAHVERELGEAVTWHLGSEPMYELWIYGAAIGGPARSCRVLDETISFFIGQVLVARGQIAVLRGAISAWLIDGAAVTDLAVRGATVERHAEVLERDPVRWHWLQVHERVADPEDMLFPLAPLISVLATSAIASRFFTYSSLNRLCFSASSHYPWVGEYPVVTPIAGGWQVGDTHTVEFSHAVALIELALAASPVAPFFGCAADHELPEVAAAFTRAGSHHVPTLLRRQQWTDVGVIHGPRRCTFSGAAVTCIEGEKRSMHECSSLDAAVAIAIAFLGA